MKKAYWIFIKELNSFLGANLPPAVIGITALMSGLVSVLLALSEGATADDVTRAVFYYLYLIMLITGLLLSMTSFVNEKKQGTLELLYTLPVTDTELVLGKYMMGVLVTSLLALLLSLVYVLIIAGAPIPLFAAGLTGLILAGLYSFSIGLFASSVTESSLISLLLGLFLILAADIGGYMAGLLPGAAKDIFTHFHGLNHFIPFTRGAMTLRSTVFFTSMSALFLFLTVKVLESRRWRGHV